MINLQCFGATGEVTGSCHLITVLGKNVLLDCGMIQGGRKQEERNREPFPFEVDSIDAVILSHAHIDHSGRLPLLVKRGYTGPIYTHHATRDLCEIMLKDSAFLQEREVQWQNKKRRRKGLEPIAPLYTIDDAEAAVKQFETCGYDEMVSVLSGVDMRLQDAGHILGAAIVELWLDDGVNKRKLVFSGDLGHANVPILRDPAIVEEADLVMLESTYGDRLHRSWEDTQHELSEVVKDATTGSGNILIPAFAVGRSQLILYWLAKNYDELGLSRWHIFLDSPMAIEATRVYTKYIDLYDDLAQKIWQQNQQQPLLPNLHMTKETEDSKAINKVKSGAIIIAGSGMCTGGRIRHHLKNNASRKDNHIIIVGFQALGTTGRAIVDGKKDIRIQGDRVSIDAKVHTVGGLSAHADQAGLISWYENFKNSPPIVLVHGEEEPQKILAKKLREKSGAQVYIARNEEIFDIVNPLP